MICFSSGMSITMQFSLMLDTGMNDCCVDTMICRCGTITLPLTNGAVQSSSITAMTKNSVLSNSLELQEK